MEDSQSLMGTAKVSPKKQVRVPDKVIDDLGLEKGIDIIKFVKNSGSIEVKKVPLGGESEPEPEKETDSGGEGMEDIIEKELNDVEVEEDE